MSKEKSEPSAGQKVRDLIKSIIKGSIIGATEAFINHPLWSIKTRIQRGEKFTLNPKILYLGFRVNMMSMVPITAVQVVTAIAVKKQMKTESDSMIPAFIGGAVSALVSTPAELIMTHMSHAGALKTANALIKNKNIFWFYTGGVGTMMREGVFTVGFFAAPKAIEAEINSNFGEGNSMTKLSGPIAGAIAAGLSHPFDTIKTAQQVSAISKEVSFMQAAQGIVNNHGFLSLYKGFTARSTRVVSAITIMNHAERKLQPYLG